MDNGDDTVTDTASGLKWTKRANLMGVLTWDEAMSRCDTYSISGISGWSLPSKDQLSALYSAMQGGHPFIGVQSSSYWSRTIYADNLKGAWFVSMKSGFEYIDIKSSSPNAWCVRDIY